MDINSGQDISWADRACETCRLRRVKCDKRLPACERCQKSGRTCSGYNLGRKFLDEGIKVRQKYNGGITHSHSHSDPQPKESTDAAIKVQPPSHSGQTEIKDLIPIQTSTENVRRLVHRPEPSSSRRDSKGEFPSPQRPPAFERSPQVGVQAHPFQSPQSTTTLNPFLGGFTQPPTDPPISSVSGIGGHPPFNFAAEADTEEHPPEHPTAKLLWRSDYAASDNASHDNYSGDDYFDLDIETYYANNNNACGFIPGVPVILSDNNEPEVEDDFLSTEYTTQTGRSSVYGGSEGRQNRSEYSQKYLNDRTMELTCLTRHFVEEISPWMDLFDQDTYFSRIVPIKAVQNAMLRSAVAAVAANQIAQLIATQSIGDGFNHLRPILGRAKGSKQVDWFYKAANYYDRGISYLRLFLTRWLNDPNGNLATAMANAQRLPSFSEVVSGPRHEFDSPHKRRRLLRQHSPEGADMEALLAAISVFSLYESLDTYTAEWSQHLDGFKALLETKILPRAVPTPQPAFDAFNSMRAGRAAFWNFARADYLAAYVNHSRTRLDTEDLVMWKAAGLPITDEGVLTYGTTSSNPGAMVRFQPNDREDSVSCALIWIVLRTMNFVAPQDIGNSSNSNKGSPLAPETPAMFSDSGSPLSSTSQFNQARMVRWRELRRQLDEWYSNLPFTFQPYATMGIYNEEEENPTERPKFSKIFFSVPMCAAALQLYHFAQILLLLNHPVEESDARNLARRMRMFRNVSEESELHSRQICGIALGRPSAAVSRQMVHPLYVAGLCFEEHEDRLVVLDLLENIEKETGCSTAQRVKDLKDQWGWNDVEDEVMVM